jgi:hypothetical protein
VVARHPTQRNRRKPFLTDNVELGHVFRKKFTDGLRRLVSSGKLKLEDQWARLKDSRELDAWLDDIKRGDWNVFIEGPPHGKSCPEHALKYLARYLTGGPISDRRIIRDEDGRITFWARSKDKARGNPSRPFSLPGREFVRRWTMHILPKGYTRSRQFGGYHGTKSAEYLERCRELLAKTESAVAGTPPTQPPGDNQPHCPCCDVPMRLIDQQQRPSWKVIFQRRIYEDATLYSPMHHIASRAPPPFPQDE